MRAGTALVTGASGGLGQEFARELAGRGWDLVLVARRTERMRSLARDLRGDAGTGIEILTADLTDERGLAAVEKRLRDDERPVDLLVNNAGVSGGTREPLGSAGQERLLVDTNVLAPVRLTATALPGMLRRGRGAVVNVGSVAGLLPGFPADVTYGASKSFLHSFSEGLALRVRARGVRVVAVCPGYLATGMVDGIDGAGDVPGPLWQSPGRVVREALDALDTARPLVVPGRIYSILAAAIAVLPRRVGRALAGKAV